MTKDEIKEISIDATGRLCVFPLIEKFPFIYRSATEVHWDDKGNFLYAPSNLKGWSYAQWYVQIVQAVKSEHGTLLSISHNTKWTNVPGDIKEQINSLSDIH
jgi:hypothetical protein